MNKGSKEQEKLRTGNAPGQVVSVDEILSTILGFIPTHLGRPTPQRYFGAIVFFDHFSDFIYIHLMENFDGESTVQAKYTLEHV